MDSIVRKAAQLNRGPGGALAIVRNGKLEAKHTYGFADLDQHIPLETRTQLPICSISKQMVCLVLADLVKNPTPLIVERGGDVEALLAEELRELVGQWASGGGAAASNASKDPEHAGSASHAVGGRGEAGGGESGGEGCGIDGELTIAHLYNMQSGIRDYWAMTTLWGAHPEGAFSLSHHAPESLARVRSFHFPPGTEFSYSNVNFHALARLIEAVSGQSLDQLLAERVFIPAGMRTALLQANTAGHPLPIVGYEGTEQSGYTPAVNRIEWSGDAGIVASLDDMIAYEAYLHRSWGDEKSNYRTIAQEQKYLNGDPASYGFGLERHQIHGAGFGQLTLGHGGALRGFRLHRIHCPEEMLSVIVMFNHEANAASAAESILRQAIRWPQAPSPIPNPAPPVAPPAAQGWEGYYLDPDTQLLVRLEQSRTHASTLLLRYTAATEPLQWTAPHEARSRDTTLRITPPPASPRPTPATYRVRIHRATDHRTLHAHLIAPLAPPAPHPLHDHPSAYAGLYSSPDADSLLTITSAGGLLYATFRAFLGTGPLRPMTPVARDIWLLPDPRGMDAPPPGDWTLVFTRGGDAEGAKPVQRVTVGCWLARKVEFVKTGVS